ncbi:MAG TPA: hypothetical protein VG013_30810 [Gemmataceae bacterium]|jgi:hypothetical protein|nr:hypothetical protein [Gemmataceae bacterium]
MPRAENGKQRYAVHLAGTVAKRMRHIQRLAARQGQGEAVLAAFRQIVQRLEEEPLVFGEPLYRLPALRMQVRHGSVRPLFINFAVCEDRPLVFIKGVKLFPESP